jgi:hypothetical protein
VRPLLVSLFVVAAAIVSSPQWVRSDTRLVPQIAAERGSDGGISLKRIVAVGCAEPLAVGMAAFGLPR